MNINQFDVWRLANEAYEAAKLTRKYTGEPYIVHPTEVVRLLIENGIREFSGVTSVIAAGFLHDVLEDVEPIIPKYNVEWMYNTFGDAVTQYVVEVTNHYTKERFPALSRLARTTLENQCLSSNSDGALAIKLADVASNTRTLWKHDQQFAEVYFKEKKQLLSLVEDRVVEAKIKVLTNLFNIARGIINDYVD